MTFYKFEIPSYDQYKYAWAEEAQNAKFSNKYPSCRICKKAVGQYFWLPPHEVTIKQPRKIGDFLYCGILSDLIVSANFKKKYENSTLTGIDGFFPIKVLKMGNRNNEKYEKPTLFGAKIRITETNVDYSKMNVNWFSPPKENLCELCCPGGGGDGGTYQSYESIRFKEKTLTNNDFFIAINFPGNIIVSESAKEFIKSNNFTNINLTPAFEAKYNMFYRKIEKDR